MVPTKAPASRSLLQQGLLIAGIVLLALNLRPALASVGPLVGAIRDRILERLGDHGVEGAPFEGRSFLQASMEPLVDPGNEL